MRCSQAGQSGRPPGPKGKFAVGNLAAYEADRLGFLSKLRAEYGPVAQLGARTTVVNGPALALKILRDRTGVFSVTETFLQRKVDGPSMAKRLSSRPHLNAALRPSASSDIRNIVVTRLGSELAALTPNPTISLDPVSFLEQVYSHSVAEFAFGSGSETIVSLVKDLLDELARVIGNPFALPGWTRSPVRRRIDARYRALFKAIECELARRAGTPDRYEDVAATIVRNSRGRHPVSRLCDMLVGALLAAQRVPAASGAWLLMLVADHPDVQERLRAAPPREGAGEASSDQLNYHVVMEALRLYPATWMTGRTSSAPTALGPWRFGKGHNFLISPYIIHRDPDLFPAPLQFLPERWRRPGRDQNAFLTFGAGLHICPGRSLATVMMSATLDVLVERYEVHRAPSSVMPDPRTTLLPTGLEISLTPRPKALGLTTQGEASSHHQELVHSYSKQAGAWEDL